MSTSTALLSALVSALVSIAVVVLAQVWTGRRERGGRAYDRRRTALAGAQDAALEVRNALSEYGPLARSLPGSASDELAAAERRVGDAFAGLDVAMTRVDDAEVIAAVATWRPLARFHYVSAEEVTTGEEIAAWTTMNDRFGNALRSDSATASALLSDAPEPGSPG